MRGLYRGGHEEWFFADHGGKAMPAAAGQGSTTIPAGEHASRCIAIVLFDVARAATRDSPADIAGVSAGTGDGHDSRHEGRAPRQTGTGVATTSESLACAGVGRDCRPTDLRGREAVAGATGRLHCRTGAV